MTRIARGRSWQMCLPVLGLVAVLTMPAFGEDPDLRRRVLDLNKITGTDVMRGELSLLAKDPKAKDLVQAGLAIVKDKKEPLSYNAALILARLAAQLKDYDSSEKLY